MRKKERRCGVGDKACDAAIAFTTITSVKINIAITTSAAGAYCADVKAR